MKGIVELKHPLKFITELIGRITSANKPKKRIIVILADFDNVYIGTQNRQKRMLFEEGSGEISAIDSIEPDFDELITRYTQKGEVLPPIIFGPDRRDKRYIELRKKGFFICVSDYQTVSMSNGQTDNKDYNRVDRNLIRFGMTYLLPHLDFDELVIISDDVDLKDLGIDTVLKGKKITVVEINRLNDILRDSALISKDTMPIKITRGREVVNV